MGKTYVKSHRYKEGRQDQSENSVSFPDRQGRRCFQELPQDGRGTAPRSFSLVSLGARGNETKEESLLNFPEAPGDSWGVGRE